MPDEIRANLRDEILKRRLPPKQTAVLEVLSRSEEPLTVADVCRLAKTTPGPIHVLRKSGLIRTIRRRLPVGLSTTIGSDDAPAIATASKTPPRPDLTAEQAATLERLVPAIESGGFAPFLIHGVTGSGKTEVYLAAIEEVVARGREAIVLVPEISLTPQTIRRFRRRFAGVAVLHSHLSDAERHRHWQSIASGEVQVVVGARSAVFAPRVGWVYWSSTKSTRAASSKKRRRDTTRAMSQSCARRWKGCRCCWGRPRHHSRAGEMPSGDVTRGWRCPAALAAGRCRASR